MPTRRNLLTSILAIPAMLKAKWSPEHKYLRAERDVTREQLSQQYPPFPRMQPISGGKLRVTSIDVPNKTITLDTSSAPDLNQSSDARDWATEFVAYVQKNPAIATDPETMTSWFATALMRGYNARQHELSATGDRIFYATIRGWSTRGNPHPFNFPAAKAIAREISSELGIPSDSWLEKIPDNMTYYRLPEGTKFPGLERQET
jgi:hypothetical protein